LTNLNLKTKKRDRLFYNKYEYSYYFKLKDAETMRGISAGSVTLKVIDNRLSNRYNSHRQFKSSPDVYVRRYNELIEGFNLLNTLTDCKIAVEYNTVIVYSNSLAHYETLVKIDKNIVLTQVIVDAPAGYIRRVKSQHKYRLQFRHVNCSMDTIGRIRQFIKQYNVSPCRALVNWLDRRWFETTEASFFIDFDDDKLELMFDLMIPGIKAKTYTIISDKYKHDNI